MRIKEKNLIILLLCLMIPVTQVFAQTLQDSITKKIDGLFTKWNTPNSPGCVIGIVRNDSLIYAKGYGQANMEYGVPNTPETIYHMASVSKQFTAYAIVLLAEQGKLQLDDDIHKYLPWFPDLKEKITIRHLLNHTSGIRDQWQLLAISGTRLDDVIKQEHIVKVLSKQQALNFKPGDQYSYSNSGFTMLAEIVKSVTGKTLRQFTDSVIFKPLGMSNTHFHDDYNEIVKNRSYSYYPNGNGFANSILSYSNAGATSLFTNVNDMAKWVVNFYEPKVGTQGSIKSLTEKGKLNNGKESDYALGIAVNTYKGWRQYSHNGADAGYRTSLTVFPDLKMGFIVFGNIADFNPSGKSYEMANLFVKDTTANVPKPTTKPLDTSNAVLRDPAGISKFAGNYVADDGTQFDFKLRNQKLYWDRYGRSDLLLKAEKDTFLLAASPDVKFLFGATNKGDVEVRQWWPGSGRSLLKYDSVNTLTDKQLQAYTGTYYCPELDCKYGIVLKGRDLILTNNKYEDGKIKLIGKDNMSTDFWWMGHLKILRGSKNQIVGFEVNDGRVMHLRFNKIS